MPMQIRFRASVAVPRGPLYHAGDVAAADGIILTEALAREYCARGWADQVPPPSVKALTDPPADTMQRAGPRKRVSP